MAYYAIGEGAVGRILLIAACLAALAGCAGRQQAAALAEMDASSLATVPDKDLCNRRASGQAIAAERQKRGLADCGAGAVECKLAGYLPGSPQYLPCRNMYIQQDQASRDRRARIMDSGPTTTTCQRYGTQVVCQHN